MALSAVKEWFARPAGQERRPALGAARVRDADAPAATAGIAGVSATAGIAAGSAPLWTPGRLATVSALWGDGYQFPGGEIETLQLARPLGLSSATTLLLLGAGGGGAACSVARKCGAWVSGFETDPDLAAAATRHIARQNLGKRVRIEAWTPDETQLPPKSCHHGLALEPLHDSRPEPALASIAAALKPGAQFALVELVTDTPLDPADPDTAAWARLERRDPAALPGEVAITRILGRLGFDVRVVEDLSERHVHQALMGWRATVRAMENLPPSRQEATAYVGEAELWLLRLRLFQSKRLRLVRWHALGGG